MCGIVGRLNFNSQAVQPDELEQMCKEIKHRGPDDQGIWLKGPVGLGSRRLSIIDLSPAGHQPISNETKTVWIVFNGEIYNFQALRSRLIKNGHKFSSKTDTEIVVHLWEEYGVNCVKYLRGMFALALWDEREKSLFLARDRVGKKPLKYYLDKQKIIFASELKAILTDKTIKRTPDLQAIDHFFSLEAVPAPLTGFQGIKKLPAASYLLIKNNQVIIKKYWQVEFLPKTKLAEPELKTSILNQLTESVRLRLISDVPVGAFLSGGVDSSAVVALMSRLGQKQIKTFSVGFEDKKYSELPYARMVAKKFKTNHQEIILTPKHWSLLPKLAEAYEEPYGDPSALPTFLVSQLAAKTVKVVLNGAGGDENFAGYQRYLKFVWLNPLGRLFPWLNSGPTIYPTAYLSLTAPQNFKKSLYQPQFWNNINPLATKTLFQKQQLKNLQPLDNVLKTDINLYLSQVLLPKVDIASMANSLEVRSPFLDQELMQFCAKIPGKYKLKHGEGKYILKKALEGILPREIIYRPKMGFGFPLGIWLRNQWQKPVKNLLLDPKAKYRKFLRPATVEPMINQPLSGEHLDRRLWRVIMLEYWLQHYFPKL
ncbi:MAG: asparagine synthase (glutamine-hydrolyzing) [Patescibacteria group bacterium]